MTPEKLALLKKYTGNCVSAQIGGLTISSFDLMDLINVAEKTIHRPIESAPTDGTEVSVWDSEGKYFPGARFINDSWREIRRNGYAYIISNPKTWLPIEVKPVTEEFKKAAEVEAATPVAVSPIPSAVDNPAGLHHRYNVTHADGSPTDPNAVYFVLRLDKGGRDPEHTAACRAGALGYYEKIMSEAGDKNNKVAHLLPVAIDLMTLCYKIEGKDKRNERRIPRDADQQGNHGSPDHRDGHGC